MNRDQVDILRQMCLDRVFERAREAFSLAELQTQVLDRVGDLFPEGVRVYGNDFHLNQCSFDNMAEMAQRLNCKLHMRHAEKPDNVYMWFRFPDVDNPEMTQCSVWTTGTRPYQLLFKLDEDKGA